MRITRPTTSSRSSRSGGRQRQVPSKTLSRHSPDHHETTVAQEYGTAQSEILLCFSTTGRIARAKVRAQTENKRAPILEHEDYPSAYEDPDPITSDMTIYEQEVHRKVIAAFGDEL